MPARWFDSLGPLCKRACLDAGSAYAPEAVLFYLARWCQKKAKRAEPETGRFEDALLRAMAGRIVANLAADGVRVMRLAAGDSGEMRSLRRLLVATARPRAQAAAPDYADEAVQKIMIVLLTGTPPARAAYELEQGPDGPSNEYVFHAPFEFWARRVVINLVIDEHRRAAREREGPPPPRDRHDAELIDRDRRIAAHDSLPGLVAAIGELPPAQRAAMVLTLSRPQVDELLRERFHELAPELFDAPSDSSPRTDEEIAERLGSRPRSVTANRSLARRKLAQQDRNWELLLDQLLPHASTRPMSPRESLTDG